MIAQTTNHKILVQPSSSGSKPLERITLDGVAEDREFSLSYQFHWEPKLPYVEVQLSQSGYDIFGYIEHALLANHHLMKSTFSEATETAGIQGEIPYHYVAYGGNPRPFPGTVRPHELQWEVDVCEFNIPPRHRLLSYLEREVEFFGKFEASASDPVIPLYTYYVAYIMFALDDKRWFEVNLSMSSRAQWHYQLDNLISFTYPHISEAIEDTFYWNPSRRADFGDLPTLYRLDNQEKLLADLTK